MTIKYPWWAPKIVVGMYWDGASVVCKPFLEMFSHSFKIGSGTKVPDYAIKDIAKFLESRK